MAGETAVSPVVVVEPLLAFCASVIEFAKRAAVATVMMANFMLVPSGEADMKTTAREVSSLRCSRAVFKHGLNGRFRAGSSRLYYFWARAQAREVDDVELPNCF
ncbi:hypothetical protein SAMN05444050_5378 [Afipia sp. GAS231]|nr:hypothetical protein SAMN05444050_5378 [Afipia sp. GAS231]